MRSVEIGSNLILEPLTYDYVESREIPFLPLTDSGMGNIGEPLADICKAVSLDSKAIYVEAEFFGGDGTQGCALFENGALVENPMENGNAINYALRWLGVSASGFHDEFEAVGLGRERRPESWLNV